MSDANGDDIYRLASNDELGVSRASACSATLDREKRQAVKSYIKTLGPALQSRFGQKDHYRPEDVRQMVVEKALSIDYLCWAYVLHCSFGDFERIHHSAGEICNWTSMRSAVSGAFFGGADFETSAITQALVSGVAEAASNGAAGTEALVGWLADVDWSGLLDWS